MAKTTISVVCTDEEKDEISRRRELRGFRSDSEYVSHLIILGTLVEELVTQRPITPEAFAGAFFTVAEKLIDIGARHVMEMGMIEELRGWRQLAQAGPGLITGKVSKPARQD